MPIKYNWWWIQFVVLGSKNFHLISEQSFGVSCFDFPSPDLGKDTHSALKSGQQAWYAGGQRRYSSTYDTCLISSLLALSISEETCSVIHPLPLLSMYIEVHKTFLTYCLSSSLGAFHIKAWHSFAQITWSHTKQTAGRWRKRNNYFCYLPHL